MAHSICLIKLYKITMRKKFRFFVSDYPLRHPRATPVDSGKHALFSMGDSSRQAPATHLFWPRAGIPRSNSLILVSTVRNKQGYHLGKWRGHTSRIFRVTAVQSWSNFLWIFFGIFQGFSNFSTYRNEVFQDIFSYRGNRWWIWWIWRLKIRWIAISQLM